MKLTQTLSRLVHGRRARRVPAGHGFGYSRDVTEPSGVPVPAWVEGHPLGRRRGT